MKTLFISLFILVYSQISQGKNLVVGVENIDYYPIYSVESGQYSGYSRELLDRFAQEYNHTLTYRPLPVVRLFHELVEGKVDLKFPDNPYWGSDIKKGTKISYSQSALNYIDGVMVSPNKLGKSIPKTLGIVRGFTPYALVDEIDQGKIKVKEFSNTENMVNFFVNRNEVEGIYFNVAVMKYVLKNLEVEGNILVYDPSIPHIESDYFLSSIKHTDIIKQFDEFLKKNTSYVQKLKEKYGVN
ncbi:substrate-binding periplasmic protein [Vibrio aquimaris]|uniref:Bacterial extracellular solute-binding protein, family 3 n=1 Tax=Vibrio aquimaris TaxID=2587862 RepID=A0A5P9CQ73_9VIBR|nr:transporter substrate-binding domain-containing protein [Vibrio aquimaris]QFT28408.1 Bacterial extracellular solute-binding protein, family 3 [Vibrio aquimaris]